MRLRKLLERLPTALLAILFLSTLLSSTKALADCNPATYQINGCDRFQLTDPNHALHLVGTFATTIITHRLLREALPLNRTEAALAAGLANYWLWSLKEFAFDDFPSSGNNIGNTLGVGAGVLFVITLE